MQVIGYGFAADEHPQRLRKGKHRMNAQRSAQFESRTHNRSLQRLAIGMACRTGIASSTGIHRSPTLLAPLPQRGHLKLAARRTATPVVR